MKKLDERRIKLVDKLWQTLFGGGESALLAPWRLRRRPDERLAVRDAELKAINGMLAELDDLHAGRKSFNRAGEIIDAQAERLASRVRLNSIIEVVEEDPRVGLEVPDTAAALRTIRLHADIEALRRSLNVRRVGLRAELVAEALEFADLSVQAVDPDWLLRWQEAAARVVATDFQDLWARVLVDEVRQPGTHSLRTLAWLATLARSDVEMIRIVSRLDLGGFICREAGGYFQDDIHGPMFAQLIDMGLIGPQSEATVTVRTSVAAGFRAVLRCHDKALSIEGVGEELALASRPLTRLGIEIFALFAGSADTVIPPFSTATKSRGYAARANFCFGVIPPRAIFGRS